MALPNGTSGYQVGAGNVGEAVLFVQGAPVALTGAATATAAQLANGLFTFNGTAGDLTLPTVADLEEGISSAAKVNAAFDFFVVNIDASGSDAITVAVGTGWTLVGAGAVAAGTSGHFRARKTGDGAWTCYRIS
jgi:hypothetical protein